MTSGATSTEGTSTATSVAGPGSADGGSINTASSPNKNPDAKIGAGDDQSSKDLAAISSLVKDPEAISFLAMEFEKVKNGEASSIQVGSRSKSFSSKTILTEDVAVEIYLVGVVGKGKEPGAIEVGAHYGISAKAVRDIWNHRTWSHCTRPHWASQEHTFNKYKLGGKFIFGDRSLRNCKSSPKTTPFAFLAPPRSIEEKPCPKRTLGDGTVNGADGDPTWQPTGRRQSVRRRRIPRATFGIPKRNKRRVPEPVADDDTVVASAKKAAATPQAASMTTKTAATTTKTSPKAKKVKTTATNSASTAITPTKAKSSSKAARGSWSKANPTSPFISVNAPPSRFLPINERAPIDIDSSPCSFASMPSPMSALYAHQEQHQQQDECLTPPFNPAPTYVADIEYRTPFRGYEGSNITSTHSNRCAVVDRNVGRYQGSSPSVTDNYAEETFSVFWQVNAARDFFSPADASSAFPMESMADSAMAMGHPSYDLFPM